MHRLTSNRLGSIACAAGFCALVVGPARAGVSGLPFDSLSFYPAEQPLVALVPAPAAAPDEAFDPECLTDLASGSGPAIAQAHGPWLTADGSLRASAGLVHGSAPTAPGPTVRDLPPPPGSASLVLSGLLMLGACGAVRSARHANWATLPDWYNDHAPERIGHATAFDLIFDAPQVCWFAPCVEDATAFQRPQFVAYSRELPSRFESQATPLAAAPRGPPA